MPPIHSIFRQLRNWCSLKELTWRSLVVVSVLTACLSFGNPVPEALNRVIENHFADGHDDLDSKGGLDLFSLEWDLDELRMA